MNTLAAQKPNDLHIRRTLTHLEVLAAMLQCREHDVKIERLLFYRWLYLRGLLHD